MKINTYRCGARGSCYEHFDHHFDANQRDLTELAQLLCQLITRTQGVNRACKQLPEQRESQRNTHFTSVQLVVCHSPLVLGYFGEQTGQETIGW